MLTAFNTALSALNANSTAISAVGNNLANLNTTGYKATDVSFADVLSQTLTGDGSTQLGMGVGSPVTTKNFTQQGAIQSSTNTLALAIQGQGFLITKRADGNIFYSRDGNLQTSKTGTLQNAQGEAIQGWTNLTGGPINTNAPAGDIVIPTGSLQPGAVTKNLSLNVNLDATAANTTTTGQPTYSTQMQVFDSLGGAHTLTVDYFKTASATSPTSPAAWTWTASLPDGTTTSTGTLNFDQSGNLISPASTAASPAIAITGFTNGAANMNVNFNLWQNGASTITQFAQASSNSSNTQDGSAASQVTGMSIGNGGAVLASLSNGKQVQVGTVAVANFVNPNSLVAVGNNDFQQSGGTSQAAIGTAGSGGRGDIAGSSVESSTVDVSTEFTRLMTYQNSYTANSRVVTTANNILEETVNLIHQ